MRKVLLLDSGSGGVNILKECVKVCPYADYLLFCDTKNLPYGSKSKEVLIDITFKNLDEIYKFFPYEIVIFACNTITSTVIDEARVKYPDIIFIGTVPAIKPALLKFSPNEILLIATEATINNNKLISKYSDSEIKFLPLNTLAPLIDENLDNLDALHEFVKHNITGEFKALVLGCTHYQALEKVFKSCFKDVEIFDSANGVARRLLSFIKKGEGYQVQIMCNDFFLRNKFLWYFFNGET